jgi:hypothetical protein
MTQQPDQHQHPHRWIALLIALLAIVGSTLVLYLAVWEHGVKLIPGDSFIYLRTAIRLSQQDGLQILRYSPAADNIYFFPITHYPPFVPSIYAILLLMGIHASLVPSVTSLVAWVIFLAGIGTLTWRYARTPLLAALVLVTVPMTHSYWYIFQMAMSEVIFLPLLVWIMVILVDLPQKDISHQRPRLALASCLIALLMLTRLVGVLILAAVYLWWIWNWWVSKPRSLQRLIGDSVILGLSVIPLASWLLFNQLNQAAYPLSTHLTPEGSLVGGIKAVLQQSLQIVLPSIHFDRLVYKIGWTEALLLYTLLLLIWGWFFWHYRPRKHKTDHIAPPRSPLWFFVVFYYLLYTLVQPFLQFWPMDARDVTSLLCLIIPWIFARMAHMRLSSGLKHAVLGGYILINSIFMLGEPLLKGFPDWIAFNPPHINSIANRQLPKLARYYGHGFVQWLVVEPVRSADIENHHPQLLSWMETLPEQTIILTNGPPLLAPYTYETTQHIFAPLGYGIPAESWLKRGDCSSQFHLVIVVFKWDYLKDEAKEIQQQIETKCPDLPKYTFQHSVAYKFPPASLDNPSHTSHD